MKRINKGQVFITTHSRDVLVELTAGDIFKIKKGNPNLFSFDSSLQSCIRSNPEAFFSDRVIVCEGPTEIGICRGLNNFRILNGKPNVSLLGIRFANGNGSTQIEYAMGFKKAGYGVSLFCDSDVQIINGSKIPLRNLGVEIIDCENNKSIENHLFEDLPWEAILLLVNYRISQKDETSVIDSIKSKYSGVFPENWKKEESISIRHAIYEASVVRGKEWFKRTDHGELLGEIICDNLEFMEGKKLRDIIMGLSKWIEND